MKNILINLAVAVSFFIAGVWYGYEKGVYNQLYYDAPVKISLYSKVLEQNKSKEFLLGSIQKEKNVIRTFEDQKSEILINLPVHSDVKNMHDRYQNGQDNK